MCFNLNNLVEGCWVLPNLEVNGERVALVELVAILAKFIGDFGDSFCNVIAFYGNGFNHKVVFSSSCEG